MRPAFRGLAGLGAPVELDGREVAARQDLQDGSAGPPAVVDRRRDGDGPLGGAAWRGATKDPWLARMLARKPRMLVAVALANRMARIVWALLTKNEYYRAPQPTA